MAIFLHVLVTKYRFIQS
ncbi:hypothetical protein LINGRAPRIM_LOCUS2068 [Linum grandiflorum]